MSKIRVLLVDDHAILRVGLVSYLRYQPDFQVVGEAEDGEQALALVAQLHPDVVVMDIAMPGMNGIEATRRICAQYPETHILILSQYADKEYALQLLQAGASGYILKSDRGSELLVALRAIAKGEVFLCQSVGTVLTHNLRKTEELSRVKPELLTPREHQILKLISDGQTNHHIASALALSINTVIWHRANLMSKLGVHSVAELIRYSIEHDLIKDR